MKDKKIGFIGRIGGKIARCLNDKTYKVTAVFGINSSVDKSGIAELTFRGRSV